MAVREGGHRSAASEGSTMDGAEGTVGGEARAIGVANSGRAVGLLTNWPRADSGAVVIFAFEIARVLSEVEELDKDVVATEGAMAREESSASDLPAKEKGDADGFQCDGGTRCSGARANAGMASAG